MILVTRNMLRLALRNCYSRVVLADYNWVFVSESRQLAGVRNSSVKRRRKGGASLREGSKLRRIKPARTLRCR